MNTRRDSHSTPAARTVAGSVTDTYLRARGPLYGLVAAAGLLLALRWGTGPLVTGAGAAILALHAVLRPRATGTGVAAVMFLDATAVGLGTAASGRLEIALPMALVMLTVAVLAAPPGTSSFFLGYVVFWLLLAYLSDLSGWPAIVDPRLRRFWAAAFGVITVGLTVTLLRRAAAELARADRLRAQMIGGVSHDLRNPLTAVVGVGELLADPDAGLTDEERRELVGMLLGQGFEARRIVEDLLASVRLEAGRLDLYPEPVVLAEQIPRILAGIDGTAAVRVADSPAGTTVLSDRVRLSQIVGNLVTNALRYGGSDVAVSWTARDGVAAIVVSDDGPGIPEGDVPALFEPFAAAGAGRTTPGSVGLGLSLSRQLARLMGGELTYRRSGDRTDLTLTLPLVPAPALTAAAAG